MNYQEYLEKMTTIQSHILKYMNNNPNDDENYHILMKYLEDQKIRENKYFIKELFHLILHISNNYHRTPKFYDKIDKMISAFLKEMKDYFSNYEIFNIFKGNKRILLFLFEQKIITPDASIAITLMKDKYKKASYHYYFFPELKNFYDENLLIEMYEIEHQLFENQEIVDIEKFKENRQTGENENEICRLIREDLIDDFVEYMRNTKLSASSQIDHSIFETNSFLFDKIPTLIEYAAFFGSNSIFKFLYLSHVKLNPSLWLYSIHGQNLEIIHFLKEKYIRPEDNSYKECLYESIKCHHNSISKSFLKAKKLENVTYTNQSLKYFNFELFPNDIINNDYIFFDFCKYDYYILVDYLLNELNIDINDVRI